MTCLSVRTPGLLHSWFFPELLMLLGTALAVADLLLRG